MNTLFATSIPALFYRVIDSALCKVQTTTDGEASREAIERRVTRDHYLRGSKLTHTQTKHGMNSGENCTTKAMLGMPHTQPYRCL
jgi:hypothetical protein